MLNRLVLDGETMAFQKHKAKKRNRGKKMPMLLLGLLITTGLQAQALAKTAPYSDETNNQNRQKYQIALKSLKAGKQTAFNQYKSQLEADLYPLAPYLTYYDYRKNLSRVSDEEIITFIDKNWDSPISESLKQRWLKQLASQQNWDAFIEHFVPEEDAKNAVNAVRYPPLGSRSNGAYGVKYFGPDYLKQANEEIFLAVQIETKSD